MNKTNFDCSINDTTVLRNLILENPDLPLLIFCGEEAWNGDEVYTQAEASKGDEVYTQAEASKGEIETLTLCDDWWLDEDDYKEKLSGDLCNEPEYRDLSDEEYEKMVDEKVKETEFIKAIVIWVG